MLSEKLIRAAAFDASGIDVASGTARLSFASEFPVLRRADGNSAVPYYEILSHAPGDMNNEIMERGAPVLLNHESSVVIGEVRKGSARVGADKMTRATVWLEEGWRPYLGKIASGEAPNSVSCGYVTTGIVSREQPINGHPVLRFSWKPFEISILTKDIKPADPKVGLGRSQSNTLMKKHTLSDVLEMALSDTRDQEYNDYPLLDSITTIGQTAPGRVREVSQAVRSIGGEVVTGRFIPFSAIAPKQHRVSTVGNFTAGGAFVQGDMHPITKILRNKNVCIPLGARVVSGLKGNFIKPRATSTTTAQSLAEIEQAAKSSTTFDQDELLPKRCAVTITVSRQWLIQGGPEAEEFVRQEMSDSIASRLEYLSLWGRGTNNEPTGLFNTIGTQSLVYGGTAATWAKVLAGEKAVSDANADNASMGWALSPTTRNVWKQAPKISGQAKFLMKGGLVNDYPALTTNNLSATHQSLFGAWDTLLLLIWGDGIEIISNPYSSAPTAQVELTANIWFNLLPLYPSAFVISADSAAS